MPNPDPTTHLTLRELHEELGKLLASHLMPDELTNVTGVALKGDGIQRVTLEFSETDRVNKLMASIKDMEGQLDVADTTANWQHDQIRDLKAKLLACQQGP